MTTIRLTLFQTWPIPINSLYQYLTTNSMLITFSGFWYFMRSRRLSGQTMLCLFAIFFLSSFESVFEFTYSFCSSSESSLSLLLSERETFPRSSSSLRVIEPSALEDFLPVFPFFYCDEFFLFWELLFLRTLTSRSKSTFSSSVSRLSSSFDYF